MRFESLIYTSHSSHNFGFIMGGVFEGPFHVLDGVPSSQWYHFISRLPDTFVFNRTPPWYAISLQYVSTRISIIRTTFSCSYTSNAYSREIKLYASWHARCVRTLMPGSKRVNTKGTPLVIPPFQSFIIIPSCIIQYSHTLILSYNYTIVPYNHMICPVRKDLIPHTNLLQNP